MNYVRSRDIVSLPAIHATIILRWIINDVFVYTDLRSGGLNDYRLILSSFTTIPGDSNVDGNTILLSL